MRRVLCETCHALRKKENMRLRGTDPFAKSMKTVQCILLALACYAASANAQPSFNYLANPGFETGDLTSWIVGGKNGGFGVTNNGAALPVTGTPSAPGLFYPSYQNVRSGTYGAYGITAGSSQGGFSEYVNFSQNITLQSGVYQLGFWLSTVDSNGGVGLSDAMTSGRLGIYVDGTKLPFTIAPPSISSLTSSWVEFASQDILAGGPHDIEFSISAGGTARVGISLDDTFVTTVPEPSTVALIVIGLIPSIFMAIKCSRNLGLNKSLEPTAR